MFIAVPLTHLTLSPNNVRKVKPSGDDTAQLRAAIESKGLLQNLIVEPSPDQEGHYRVTGGGRRLAILQALQNEGKIPEDYDVPCKVENEDPETVSLMENTVRTAMHPADQFEAWARLVKDGVSASDIAVRFGVEEALVRRRLKLGKLAPAILEAFRENKINLERLMALTLSDDHEQQLALLERILEAPYNHQPHEIRRIITGERVSSKSRVAKFVGLETYEAADGIVLKDLFSEDGTVYFEDPVLLAKLADEKLANHATDLLADGWKWTKTAIDLDQSELNELDHIQPHPIGVPDEVTDELDALEKRTDELSDLDGDEWTDEMEAEWDTLVTRQRELEQVIQSHKGFDIEEKNRSGCAVTIKHNGDLQIISGLVRKEDAKADPGCNDDEALVPADKQAEDGNTGYKLSNLLVQDLIAHRLQITKSHLASDYDLAFDLATFSLCRDVFSPSNYYHVKKPLDLRLGKTEETSSRKDLDGTKASKRREALLESFDLSWLNDDYSGSFEAFCALSVKEKQRLFAYCIAQGLHGQLAADDTADPVLESVGVRLGIDVAEHWRPTADNFWSRITKSHGLALASEVLGAQWVLAHTRDKKSVLATKFGDIFTCNASGGFPAAVQEAAVKWIPACMAYAAPEPQPQKAETAEQDPAKSRVDADNVSIQPPVSTSAPHDTAREDQSSDRFLEDHVQVVHVGGEAPPVPDEADGAAVNDRAVNGDASDDDLPPFLRETG